MSKKGNNKHNSKSSFSKDFNNKPKNELKDNVFVYTTNMTIDELSKKINVSSSEIIKYFFNTNCDKSVI